MDELSQNMNTVFPGFQEAKISFPPTYKYSINKTKQDGDREYSKKRLPAYCDRIIYHQSSSIQCYYYSSKSSSASDHDPVVASFRVSLTDLEIEKKPLASPIDAADILAKRKERIVRFTLLPASALVVVVLLMLGFYNLI